MISYLVIFFYAFNDCCLINIYTKLYLEHYFRLLYNVYNMVIEVVHIIKKNYYFIFLLVPRNKFLQIFSSTTIDPLPKKKKKILER